MIKHKAQTFNRRVDYMRAENVEGNLKQQQEQRELDNLNRVYDKQKRITEFNEAKRAEEQYIS